MALDQQETFRQLVDERNALVEKVRELEKQVAAARLAGRIEQAEKAIEMIMVCGCHYGELERERDRLRTEALLPGEVITYEVKAVDAAGNEDCGAP